MKLLDSVNNAKKRLRNKRKKISIIIKLIFLYCFSRNLKKKKNYYFKFDMTKKKSNSHKVAQG